MAILFPLVLVPTYQSAEGDEQIFYAVVAGILSGSVAGDHMSPISDTTVLSSLATECGLMRHVGTQAPYVAIVTLISIVLGTVPIGYDAWPNIVGILLGFLLCGVFVFLVCKPILSPTGDWDMITKLFLIITKQDEGYEQLQKDTIRAASGEDLSEEAPAKTIEPEEEAAPLAKDLDEGSNSNEEVAEEVVEAAA